ncbi:MAG: glutaredoxin family protein [Candidatus Paceibacterota bacterium]
MKTNKKVQIYTSPTCHYCHMAKDFFANNGIKYEEFDVMIDVNKRQEMIEISGQMGVPVIVVDDQPMVGFDEGHLKSVLGL